MNSSTESGILEQRRPLAIIRLDDLSQAVAIAAALREGGIRHVEFSLTNRDAFRAVGEVRRRFAGDLTVGIGTVMSSADVTEAAACGAQFLVTPILDAEVLETAGEAGLPIICGAATPTEMVHASRLGAAYVKLFPCVHIGPSYVSNILAALPALKIVCVGGINASNAAAFIAAGAFTVGVGSSLVSRESVNRSDWVAITKAAESIVDLSMRSQTSPAGDA